VEVCLLGKANTRSGLWAGVYVIPTSSPRKIKKRLGGGERLGTQRKDCVGYDARNEKGKQGWKEERFMEADRNGKDIS